MAEESTEVLFRVRIDDEQTKKEITNLTRELENNKRLQAELNKEMKQGGVVTAEQAARQAQLKREYTEVSGQLRVQTKALETNNKIQQAAAGSITQMRAQLSQLTAQWNELSEEERENVEIGGRLQKETKALSDKLKGLEGSVGDTRRNVGNYTGGILEAVDGTGLLTTITQKAKAAQEGFAAAHGVVKSALIGNVGALKLFRLALISTGIGAVVVLLGGLISFLTRTQEGIDLVSQKTKGLTTIMGVLIDNLSAVGKATMDWFDDVNSLGDLLKKLSDVFIQGVITRAKGLMVVLKGIRDGDFTKIQDGIAQVTIGVENATEKAKNWGREMNEVRKTAEAIEKEYQRIRDAEIALTVEREKANAVIAQQKRIAEDVTKSEAERIAAAKAAADALATITNQELKLQRERVANIQAEQALTNNLAADNQALAEAQAKLAQIEAQNTERSIELQNKLNGIRKEAAANRAAAAKAAAEAEYEALQLRLADEKAAAEVSLLYTIEGSEERLEAQIQLAAKEMEIALNAKNLTENQKRLIQAKFDQEELTARQAHAQKIADLAKAQAQKDADERKTVAQKALSDAQAAIAARTEAERQAAEERAAIRRAEYEAASAVTAAMGELANLVAGQSAEAAEFQKAITLFQIAIDTARAISNITQGAAKVGTEIAAVSGPAGLVTGPAATISYYATNVATLLANIAKAKQLVSGDAPKAPQFAEGGYTGAGGKYEPAGIVHKGEYVLPQYMVQAFPQLVANLEQMRLKGYATGGLVTPAYTAPPRFSPAAGIGIDYNRLAQAMANMPAPVNRWSDFVNMSDRQARVSKFKDL